MYSTNPPLQHHKRVRIASTRNNEGVNPFHHAVHHNYFDVSHTADTITASTQPSKHRVRKRVADRAYLLEQTTVNDIKAETQLSLSDSILLRLVVDHIPDTAPNWYYKCIAFAQRATTCSTVHSPTSVMMAMFVAVVSTCSLLGNTRS